jgi:predicted DNA-binding protein (MmcQ/YjbR family)
MARQNALEKAKATLRKKALDYPETTEDFPWGHSAFKVKGKGFLFTYLHEEEGFLSLSVKLPISSAMALTFPFASPTEYGMGKHGWVTSRFYLGDEIPLDMLIEWMDESFRAVAPKKVLALLEKEEPRTR